MKTELLKKMKQKTHGLQTKNRERSKANTNTPYADEYRPTDAKSNATEAAETKAEQRRCWCRCSPPSPDSGERSNAQNTPIQKTSEEDDSRVSTRLATIKCEIEKQIWTKSSHTLSGRDWSSSSVVSEPIRNGSGAWNKSGFQAIFKKFNTKSHQE